MCDRKKWSEKEISKLKALYSKGEPTNNIASIMNRSHRSIRGKAHLLGLTHKARNDYLYTATEDKYLVEFCKLKTRNQIAQKLGRSEGSISHRGRRLNLEFKSTLKHTRYTKNHSYFDIPDLENCYIAGLIASDGWIRPYSSNKPIYQVGIAFKRADRALLVNMKKRLKYSGPIRDFTTKTGYKVSELRMNGVPQWIIALEKNWSITPVKSLTLNPPTLKLASNCLHGYLAGLIEGDGSIRVRNGTLAVEYFTSSPCFAPWISKQWHYICGEKPTLKKITKSHKNPCYTIHLYGGNARRLATTLMIPGIVKMNRKWDIANQEIRRLGI